MIYLKRFCFAIVCCFTLLLMVAIIILQLTTFPIFGLLFYTFTGKDPLTEEYMNFSVIYSMKFLDWYKNKFGPNDD